MTDVGRASLFVRGSVTDFLDSVEALEGDLRIDFWEVVDLVDDVEFDFWTAPGSVGLVDELVGLVAEEGFRLLGGDALDREAWKGVIVGGGVFCTRNVSER